MIRYILLLILSTLFLYAAPALHRVQTFSQPDGTTFEGVLRGDAAMHWIESNGEIVVQDPKDGYFKKAVIQNNRFVPTQEKPTSLQQSRALFAPKKGGMQQHTPSRATQEALRKMRHEIEKKDHPF